MTGRPLHVLAGVVRDASGNILLSRRPDHKHQGGLWEFPGGKLHDGETRLAALRRELLEELAIRVEDARPLIRVQHDYPDLTVDLDVWLVERFSGSARSCEGQDFRWVGPHSLADYAFPEANLPILNALGLPDRYWITPDVREPEVLLDQVVQALGQGIRLLQFRAPSMHASGQAACAQAVLKLVREVPGARLLVNGDPGLARAVGADGLHLKQAQLMQLQVRPEQGADQLCAASCHDAPSLARAAAIGLDFACLSPVAVTPTHPGSAAKGWAWFETLVAGVNLPVYALGGLGQDDLQLAWQSGGQGIAGIRGLL